MLQQYVGEHTGSYMAMTGAAFLASRTVVPITQDNGLSCIESTFRALDILADSTCAIGRAFPNNAPFFLSTSIGQQIAISAEVGVSFTSDVPSDAVAYIFVSEFANGVIPTNKSEMITNADNFQLRPFASTVGGALFGSGVRSFELAPSTQKSAFAYGVIIVTGHGFSGSGTISARVCNRDIPVLQPSK